MDEPIAQVWLLLDIILTAGIGGWVVIHILTKLTRWLISHRR